MSDSFATVAGWGSGFAALLIFGAAVLGPDKADAADVNGAVAVMYHRFGDNRFPSTNVTVEQLDGHIAELKNGAYNVMLLGDVVEAIENGQPLPACTVSISIDDAYATVFEIGWPKFRAAGLPVTLFVSTGPVDRGLDGMMTWDQIRQMHEEGAEIGAHTVTHLHMTRADLPDNRREIVESNARFLAEIGKVPALFAYPYGEASREIAMMVRNNGYRAAFGQHSGVITGNDDRYYLPRFPINEKYGDIERFRMVVNALPLRVIDMIPDNMLIDSTAGHDNPPPVGFTVMDSLANLDQLACFFSHEGKAQIARLGETRIEVRAETPMPKGRARLNCTLPGMADNRGRWHWYGHQFVIQ